MVPTIPCFRNPEMCEVVLDVIRVIEGLLDRLSGTASISPYIAALEAKTFIQDGNPLYATISEDTPH